MTVVEGALRKRDHLAGMTVVRGMARCRYDLAGKTAVGGAAPLVSTVIPAQAGIHRWRGDAVRARRSSQVGHRGF
jgi:hypothetical protein